MTDLHLEIEIESSPETVFATLVDLRGYGRWLPRSTAFPGTTEISPGPVRVGTTYVESAPSGVRRGTITELARPTRMTFHQPMTLKPKLLGVIDMWVRYALTQQGSWVHLDRDIALEIPWQLKLLQPFVVRQFRSESGRTLRALKAHVEGAGAAAAAPAPPD
jgi:uncharacterized protein YndB with AHSA1/START domain